MEASAKDLVGKNNEKNDQHTTKHVTVDGRFSARGAMHHFWHHGKSSTVLGSRAAMHQKENSTKPSNHTKRDHMRGNGDQYPITKGTFGVNEPHDWCKKHMGHQAEQQWVDASLKAKPAMGEMVSLGNDEGRMGTDERRMGTYEKVTRGGHGWMFSETCGLL